MKPKRKRSINSLYSLLRRPLSVYWPKPSMYCNKPLDIVFDIPVFSHRDEYVQNYELISANHLKLLDESGINPFMQQEQIQVAERETRVIVRKHVQPGGAILDAGVGLGELVAGLSEFECHGVDISIPYLRRAKSKGINVTMAKLEELPFSDQYFDAVVSCDVLEHVFRLDSAIEQILRVLKSNGMLIVRVPNEESLNSYITKTQPYSHSHVREFSLASLRLYFEKCFGLQFVEHKYIGYLFNSSHQIKYQFPELGNVLRIRFSEILQKNPGLLDIYEFGVINKLLDSSIEEMVDALISICKEYPEIFEVLSLELIKPLELVAVFRRIK